MNEKELKIINETQREYEELLIEKIINDKLMLKVINFSSPTGTGKTKMMAEIIDRMPMDYYFFITTLSKGQLNIQIRNEIRKYTQKCNWCVYGLNDFTKNTILQAKDILSLVPKEKRIIWFRDEGHINTNRWMEILEKISYKIINISATNKFDSDDDINCNFSHTTMLRTVHQSEGEPEDAIKKLLEVKENHKTILNYNPCAIFRILDDGILGLTIKLCKKYNLRYINITDEEYDMSEICKDDNEYDVIINKFKIVEGIDIRRAHVLYMTNEPSNPSTTIQIIGRCRRNALLYRDDIDIFSPENSEILDKTRSCYVYYNVRGMKIDEDDDGNLVSTFCDTISVEQLKPNISIELNNGYLKNGLKVFEANGVTGTFFVDVDEKTGFNYLSPETDFYFDNFTAKYDYIECVFKHRGKIWWSSIYKISDLLDDYNLDLIKNHKIITLSAKYEVNYPLSSEKNDDILNYIASNEIIPAIVSINKKNKCPYIVEYSEVSEPVLSFDDEIDFNNMKTEDILNRMYHIKYDKIRRFKTRTEMDAFLESIKQKYPISKYTLVNHKIDFKICRPRYHPIMRYNYEPGNTTKKYKKTVEDFYRFKRNYSDRIYSINYGNHMIPSDRVINDEINDREIALLSGDMRIIKRNNEYYWIEDRSVTSKVGKYTKFNRYITNKYANCIKEASKYFYHFDNIIFKTKKLNSMFGYCVEYTSKLLFELFSKHQNSRIRNVVEKILDEDITELDYDKIQELIKDNNLKARIVKESIDEYRSQMSLVYSLPSYVLPSISLDKLVGEIRFLNEVFDKSIEVVTFLKQHFNLNEDNIGKRLLDNQNICNLSVKHICGLADYIIDDMIIDLKCTSEIKEEHIKQILSYYWLAEKHKLGINKIMIYEAMKGKYIIIDVKNGTIDSNVDITK